jgi:adenylate cyclase
LTRPGRRIRAGAIGASIRPCRLPRALQPADFGTLDAAACFFSLAGEIDRALDLLERAVEGAGGHRGWIAHDTDLAPLREHPRFRALLAAAH